MSELLPCPFCGGTDIKTHDLYGTKWMTMCEAGCCGRSGLTEEDSIKAWNTRADGWVSVDDRLPEYGKPVIIIANGHRQNVIYFRDNGGEDHPTPDWYEVYRYGDDTDAYIPAHLVTHWMPLPEAPHE